MSEASKARWATFLTPEQLRRKREGDRRSQKHARERTRSQINALEARIHELDAQNRSLRNELTAAVNQCKCSGQQNLRRYPQDDNNQDRRDAEPQRLPEQAEFDTSTFDRGNSLSSPDYMASNRSSGSHCSMGVDLAQMLDENLPGLDFALWTGTLDYEQGSNCQEYGPAGCSADKPVPSLVDTRLPLRNTRYVWSVLPEHTHPTCLVDRVVIDLIRSRRQLELSGGNVQEFQRMAFPSIQSLLNPTNGATGGSPVTSTIVNDIIRVLTVPTLPEQIAMLYVMSSIIRWQISPTESNYDSMPEWLRPTLSQLTEPHPGWLDFVVWPKARERMCRQSKYHNRHSIMSKVCDESLSINWPHDPSDMILQVNGTEWVLNPIFDRHIKSIENWTVGRRISEVCPKLVDEVNIK